MQAAICLAMVPATLSGCAPSSVEKKPPPLTPSVMQSAMARLGKQLFFDPSLSASGQQSCASCHSPDHAFGPPNGLALQLGGLDMHQQGTRTAPSLRYLADTPPFSIGATDMEDDDDADRSRGARHPTVMAAAPGQQAKIAGRPGDADALVPQGGFFWDGRANTLQQQALGPILNPLEMANATIEDFASRLQKLDYLRTLQTLVDPHILNDARRLPSYALFAISRYELEDPDFHPFSSKYDAFLRGQATLTTIERRGLALFEDPHKGNCAACHPSKPSKQGHPPLFSDFQFEALGVPRNAAINANADPRYFDLGLCGPSRRDGVAVQPQNCGLFKTPSLRNVATRHAFFHNGVFQSLEEVLHFYAERDIHPEKFYPLKSDGRPALYNDLPDEYHANIDHRDPPFDRRTGDRPALDQQEIQDIIAFLRTLNDGFELSHR